MVNFIKRDKKDIFNMPILGYMFKNSKFLLILRLVVASIFFYSLYYGFINQSKENIFTPAVYWSLFWSLFMVITLPFLGRVFCSICPHGFLGKYITKIGLKKTAPKFLKNRYIGIFILVVLWWGVYYTFPGLLKTPLGTALMFTTLTIVAFVMYFIYKDMSYCKSVCPIGVFTRAYDKLSFTKLQTYQSACKDCRTFECATSCPYNLKPFTFEKKNSSEDCTLCMECANSCEAVSFNITKPAAKLDGKFKALGAEIWAYILILGAIPISMTFAHGLNRSNISEQMIWNQTAGFLGLSSLGGMFAFIYAVLCTVFFAVLGLYLASKVLEKDFSYTFKNLGYAYAPLFIFGTLGHALESFFTKDYAKIVNGFAQGFNSDFIVLSLAKRGDDWLHYFALFKYIAIAATLYMLYIRLKNIDVTKSKKVFAYFFASFLVIFFISVNVYRSYVFETYGVKKRTHNHSSMKKNSKEQNSKKTNNISVKHEH